VLVDVELLVKEHASTKRNVHEHEYEHEHECEHEYEHERRSGSGMRLGLDPRASPLWTIDRAR
jgi:hypothetical protein